MEPPSDKRVMSTPLCIAKCLTFETRFALISSCIQFFTRLITPRALEARSSHPRRGGERGGVAVTTFITRNLFEWDLINFSERLNSTSFPNYFTRMGFAGAGAASYGLFHIFCTKCSDYKTKSFSLTV